MLKIVISVNLKCLVKKVFKVKEFPSSPLLNEFKIHGIKLILKGNTFKFDKERKLMIGADAEGKIANGKSHKL